MKTTVDLPDELLIEAKKHAARSLTTLRVILERGLRRELSADNAPAGGGRPRRNRIRWVTVPGGLPRGLDISDRASMHDWIRTQR